MKIKALKEQVSVTLDGNVIKQVKYFAEEDERSLSQYINRVLKKHIKDKENKL